MGGVNCGIDAIGFQARDRANPAQEKPDQVIHDLARLLNPNGRLGIIGVFLPNDAKPAGEVGKHGDLTVPWQMLFKSSYYADVSLNQWLALTPSELVQAHLNLDHTVMGALQKAKRPIV